LLLFLLVVFYNNLLAQSDLSFDTKHCTEFVHGVSKVIVLDQRRDTGSVVGFIRSGKMNSKKALVAKPNLAYLIEDFYTQLSKQSDSQSNSQIVILLYAFLATEDNTGFSEETARFTYAADYFLSDDGIVYRLLGSVDEVVFVRSLDVTQLFLKTLDRSLCGFYEGFYSNPISQEKRPYSYNEVCNFKEEQKKNFKAYTTDSFRNAYFVSWDDFLALRSKQNEGVVKKGNRFKATKTYIDGKIEKSSLPEEVKVFAFDNRFYYLYDNNAYQMYKKENDFFIMGFVPTKYWGHNGIVERNIRYQQSLEKSFPKIDGDMPSNFFGCFEFKIEPRNGNLIPIRKISSQKLK
jgi:hypothetical protein